MRKKGPRIEIPGDPVRDRHLQRLADEMGFKTLPILLRHVAFEISRADTPAEFYRALARFHEEKAWTAERRAPVTNPAPPSHGS